MIRRIGPADHGQVMTLDEFAEAEFEDGYLHTISPASKSDRPT